MSKSQTLSEQQIKAIKTYGNDIVTMEDFTEIVRKRPGMYLGPIGQKGFLNMIREIIQNSFDQINNPLSPASYVILTYDELSYEVEVEDNGMGIPFDNLVRIFSQQHTSSHFNNKAGQFSSGLHGIGSKVVNAMSYEFVVRSYVLGEGREVIFRDGKVYKDEHKISNNGKQGTVVKFVPSLEALKDPIDLSYQEVMTLIEHLLPLNNYGCKVICNMKDKKGIVHTFELVNSEGIYYYMKDFNPVIKDPIYIIDTSDDMKMETLITFDSNFESMVFPFANFCPTAAGTHLNGFIDGVSYWFKNYMNNVYLKTSSRVSTSANSKKKKPTNQLVVELADVKLGLRGVIHAVHIEPNFTGQAKEILSNSDVYPYVKNTISKGLQEWATKNPTDLQKICKFLKEVAELRLEESKQRVKISNRYASSIGGYPVKFAKPTGPRRIWDEFWCCEGESAGGTAKPARIKATQGIYPLKGKILNAFNNPPSKILANEECTGILNIIGGGYGKDFDLSKVPWKKVGVMADADIDGGHIATLFLIFMLVYCKPLVEDGRVYKAVPPLYGAKIGGRMVYFSNMIDFVKYVEKEFLKTRTIAEVRGGTINNLELAKTFIINEDLVFELERLASTFAIDPIMLELLLVNHKQPFNKIKSIMNKNYRFIQEMRQVQDTIYIDALVNKKYNTIIMNDKLINAARPVLDILNKNSRLYFDRNGETISLYQLMSEYERSKPSEVRRFKGLGEMDAKALKESTLDPNGARMIIRYTVDDIVEELNTLRYFNSNMDEIGKDRIVRRIDLMD